MCAVNTKPAQNPKTGPSKESLFEYLDKTIGAFLANTDALESALVLPPCNSYFRFLIHQYVSDKYVDLFTFSVGELNERRTVVHGAPRKTMEEPIREKKKSVKGMIYVPPHARTAGGTPSPQPDARSKKKSAKNNSARMCDDSSLLFKENDLIFTESLNSRRWKKTKSNSSDPPFKEEGPSTCKEEPRKDLRHPGETSSVAEGVSLEPENTPDSSSLSVDCADWESLYDDSGNSRSAGVLPEIDQNSLKEIENRLGSVKISSPSEDFLFHADFDPPDDANTSIIEIYGFPDDFKTNDLVNIFSNFISRGFALKWVDSTHALGIFPSTLMAEEALSSNLPNVKTRPIHKATSLSREKAESLVLPSVMRPKTCSVTAKRLVSSALGLKQKVSAEDREKEKKLLQEAREKRRLMVKQKEAAWEGIFFD